MSYVHIVGLFIVLSVSREVLTHISVSDQVNATWACENDRTLNQILKGELWFQGYVMSDWGGHHSTLAAVAGLDVRNASCVRFWLRMHEAHGGVT